MSSKGKNVIYSDWDSPLIEDDYESDVGLRSSSTLSWTDEAEKEITHTLREHFNKFEAALYSEISLDGLTNDEKTECEQWKSHGPHLRVVGKSVNFKIPTCELEKFPDDYEEIIYTSYETSDTCSASTQTEPNSLPILNNRNKSKRISENSGKFNLSNAFENLQINGSSQGNVLNKKSRFGSFNEARHGNQRAPASARQPKRKPKLNEYETGKDDSVDYTKLRNNILPPIEAVAVTPKAYNKRAASAMLRFVKTQPRTRPKTSKNKTIYLRPINDSDDLEDIRTSRNTEVNSLVEDTVIFDFSHPPRSGKAYYKTNRLQPRWKY